MSSCLCWSFLNQNLSVQHRDRQTDISEVYRSQKHADGYNSHKSLSRYGSNQFHPCSLVNEHLRRAIINGFLTFKQPTISNKLVTNRDTPGHMVFIKQLVHLASFHQLNKTQLTGLSLIQLRKAGNSWLLRSFINTTFTLTCSKANLKRFINASHYLSKLILTSNLFLNMRGSAFISLRLR